MPGFQWVMFSSPGLYRRINTKIQALSIFVGIYLWMECTGGLMCLIMKQSKAHMIRRVGGRICRLMSNHAAMLASP
ncbi:hypothetical protein MHYP_G00083430 [Metynnis hypsauchen]